MHEMLGGGVYLICILFQHAVRLDHFEGENNNIKKLWMSCFDTWPVTLKDQRSLGFRFITILPAGS